MNEQTNPTPPDDDDDIERELGDALGGAAAKVLGMFAVLVLIVIVTLVSVSVVVNAGGC